MSDECMELQNIKYQTMLLNSNSKVTSNKVDSLNIDSFLEKEKAVNKEKPWNKLGKNEKIRKITEYINKYTEEFKSTKEERAELKIYLVKCLERKKLQRVKDVIYDSNLGIIKNIPGLSFDKIKRKFTLKKVDKKKRIERSMSLLKEMGIADKANQRPSELSGGQQQRVAVARALASKPNFILADEPTANLDSVSTSNLLDMMAKMNKEENATFVFSTHDQRVIDKARRVVTLEDGKIVSDETK